ncbi:MAG: biotin/lipoyl-containing protein [Armatimonadota bacterium]|jgi:pyruvate dehydrogenase E2 component (dihydrolipoamide acetyltransferase)
MGELCIIEKWAENLDEATVSRWLVDEGDEVVAGDGICEIITDKATFEYEAEVSGFVKAIYAPPRSTVPVGYVIAFIGDADEDPPDDIEERNRRVMEDHASSTEDDLDLELELDLPRGGSRELKRRGDRKRRVRGTPAARRVAAEFEVSLEEVAEAMDVSGVVNEDDVRRYVGRK